MHQLRKYFVAAIFTCIGLLASPFGLLDAAAHTSVPFRTVNGNVLILSVSLNGEGPYEFVLDTGTNTSLIDSGLVASLGLLPVDRITLSTLTGTTAVPRYFIKTLTLGDAEVQQVEVLAQDLRALHAVDRRIRGILGLSALRQYSFQIDNMRKRLDLYAGEEEQPFPTRTYTQVEVVQDCILVPALSKAARGRVLKLGLDSGVSQVVVWGESILDRGSSSNRGAGSFRAEGFTQAAATTRVRTNSSDSSAATARIDSLEIGPARLRSLSVVVLGTGMPAPAPGEDGLLPVSLFRLVFFDRKNSRIFLEPK